MLIILFLFRYQGYGRGYGGYAGYGRGYGYARHQAYAVPHCSVCLANYCESNQLIFHL